MPRCHCSSVASDQTVLSLPTNFASSLFHVDLFSVICLLSNSLLTQTIPIRQTLLSLTLIRRNALAMAKVYISYIENASPISLQMSVWLCRTFLLQASVSCEKNSSEEQITLYAWYWSLVTKEKYLQNWMYCMLSESNEMFLGAKSLTDAKRRMM